MTLRHQVLLLPILFVCLFTLPSHAFDGDVEIDLGSATCFNHSTGAVAEGRIRGGKFDCNALSYDEQDQVGVVLIGEGDGPPPCSNPPCGCDNPTVYRERTPGPGGEEIGVPDSDCIIIEGTIDIPGELDVFRLELDVPTDIHLLLEPLGNAQWAMGLGDGREIVHVCDAFDCPAQVSRNPVDVIITADAPSDYRITVTVGGARRSLSGAQAGVSLKVGAPYSVAN